MTRARQPALFVGHGSPLVAVQDDAYTDALAHFGRREPKPKAVVVVSAHWEAPPPVRAGAAERPELIYDFGGFPDELYRLTYPCPGDVALARDIVRRLNSLAIYSGIDSRRGLDHGAWIPLRRLFPGADVPVVPLSLPMGADPREALDLGEALAPLRDEGVLLLGSGNVVHNLRRINFADKAAPPDGWAAEFDSWFAGRLAARDVEGLAGYAAAPQAREAVPSPEHLHPAFFVIGAGGEDPMTWVHEGFHHGSISMRSFAFGA